MTASGPFPAAPSTLELVDWIEGAALMEEWPAISTNRVARALQERRAQVDDGAVDIAMRDIRRRIAWEGPNYPWEQSGKVVLRVDTNAALYTMLLLISTNVGTATLTERSKAFENLCHVWAAQYLGEGAESVLFSRGGTERPVPFPEAVKWIARRMGLEHGSGYTPPRRNDGGADIVAWRPFSDGAESALVLLGQCTVRSDFVHKAADIDLRTWNRWIRFVADPIRMLMVPHVVSPRDTRWVEVRDRGVVLVDRRRLCSLLTCDDVNQRYGENYVEDWVERHVSTGSTL